MKKIQDYDSINYDYRCYWKDREYENLSEQRILKKILKDKKGISFIDIGGAYGRLTDLYKDKFEIPILFDYSLKNLKKAKFDKKVVKICGDIYNMPFKDESIQSGMCIRVLHHIEDPESAIKEIGRITADFFILEFANKNNFLSLLRNKFSPNFIKKDKYEIPHKSDSQGYLNDQVFLNFSPNFIKKTVLKNKFFIKKVYSVSNFRERNLKKIFPLKFLLFLEDIFRDIFSKIYFGPSIFLYLEKRNKKSLIYKNLEDILMCTKCKNGLKNGICSKCKINYLDKSGIFNFRSPLKID